MTEPSRQPIWDLKKIEKDQFLSQTNYYNVLGLTSADVTVEN